MRCDVLVQWMVWMPRSRDYGRRQQWHRGIEAPTLTQACQAAVAEHANTICPSVSAAWPIYPQPGRTPAPRPPASPQGACT